MAEDNTRKESKLGEHPINRLSPDEIDEIAEKAAEKAINKVYQQVGESVVRKVAWALGIVVLGLLTWLGAKGIIK